jgi:hypothetical protein
MLFSVVHRDAELSTVPRMIDWINTYSAAHRDTHWLAATHWSIWVEYIHSKSPHAFVSHRITDQPTDQTGQHIHTKLLHISYRATTDALDQYIQAKSSHTLISHSALYFSHPLINRVITYLLNRRTHSSAIEPHVFTIYCSNRVNTYILSRRTHSSVITSHRSAIYWSIWDITYNLNRHTHWLDTSCLVVEKG